MDILENAKPENCFYCIDGSVLRSILELEQKLRTISSRAFYHHVSQSRNDFRNWVRDVFHEHNLANEMLRAKTPAEAAAAVRRHIRKTFLAEEEIENAIRKVVEEKRPAVAVPTLKAAPAAATKIKKRHLKNKAARKNRKLNKRQNTPKQRKRGTRVRRSRSNSGNMLQKAVKKQARQWLKWLNINPEL